MKVTVITISDRAARGIYEDLSGPAIEKILQDNLENIAVARIVVPDEKDEILKALRAAASSDFILTTGGTGLSARDITRANGDIHNIQRSQHFGDLRDGVRKIRIHLDYKIHALLNGVSKTFNICRSEPKLTFPMYYMQVFKNFF